MSMLTVNSVVTLLIVRRAVECALCVIESPVSKGGLPLQLKIINGQVDQLFYEEREIDLAVQLKKQAG